MNPSRNVMYGVHSATLMCPDDLELMFAFGLLNQPSCLTLGSVRSGCGDNQIQVTDVREPLTAPDVMEIYRQISLTQEPSPPL